MDNEKLSFLRTRRSIRRFKPDQVPAELLDAILDTGTYAPTAMGAQSPVIVAVQDQETRGQLIRMNARILGTGDDPYYGAPTILVVLGPRHNATFVEDASNVLTYLQLAAHALGLGAVWVHREREMFDTEGGKLLLRKWGLPEDLAGVGAIALGFPDCEIPKPAARKKDYCIKIQ